MNRRESIQAVAGLAAMCALPGRAAPSPPKAVLFDTFGTIVDWRGSIVAEGTQWGKARNLQIDWANFADRWRAGYAPSMDRVRKGQLPWTKLDALHRMVLAELLQEFGITGLTEEEKQHWNFVWHRLKPWPDSVSGLRRIKKKFTIGPLSNGNVSLLNDMAKFSGLPWDVVLSAELARHYKPDRETYLMAAEILGNKPGETMLAAAHVGDLEAAREVGLQTAFIYRPHEYGDQSKADKAKPGDFDLVVNSVTELASVLGA
jgi:2-haloacid dehalogenase